MGHPLTCKDLIAFLDDYFEGDQPAEVRSEFERHLAVCPQCRDYLKTYDATVHMARTLASCGPAAPAPADVPEDLVRAILAARSKLAAGADPTT